MPNGHDEQWSERWFDELEEAFQSSNEPFVDPQEARDALEAGGFDDWLDAVGNGLIDYETAAYLADFGLGSPYDMNDVSIEWNAYGCDITIETESGTVELHFDDPELPDWIWQEFYDLIDDMDVPVHKDYAKK